MEHLHGETVLTDVNKAVLEIVSQQTSCEVWFLPKLDSTFPHVSRGANSFRHLEILISCTWEEKKNSSELNVYFFPLTHIPLNFLIPLQPEVQNIDAHSIIESLEPTPLTSPLNYISNFKPLRI